MARYIGPKTKIARKFGEAIFGPDKAFERRNYPPGQHGNAKRRNKKSDYGVQLQEKQKAKYTYGILERQFENLFDRASRKQGITGEILLQYCETRLDNIIFRLGVAPSRRAARQLVTHRHITVNGEVCNIPSRAMKPGDKFGVREKSKTLEVITESLRSTGKGSAWLNWNDSTLEGELLNYPSRAEIPENINEQLIVELYSK
ncbi:MAG: 30S ribosomal protein S4 [Flavobacteriales bacterium]|nr:30S ribosomal protein S4 [Flavobacteriales bacterium]